MVARREALIVEFSSERFSNGLLHKAESLALKNVNDEHKAGNDFYLSFPSSNNIEEIYEKYFYTLKIFLYSD